MGYRPDRILKLKSAVVRYQMMEELGKTIGNALESNVTDVEMTEPSGEDILYQSDYDDDTV
jgi:hypothetical protein